MSTAARSQPRPVLQSGLKRRIRAAGRESAWLLRPSRGCDRRSSFWINRTRGGCGVTFWRRRFGFAPEELRVPGVPRERERERIQSEEREAEQSPFWLSRSSRSMSIQGPAVPSQSVTDSAVEIR